MAALGKTALESLCDCSGCGTCSSEVMGGKEEEERKMCFEVEGGLENRWAGL